MRHFARLPPFLRGEARNVSLRLDITAAGGPQMSAAILLFSDTGVGSRRSKTDYLFRGFAPNSPNVIGKAWERKSNRNYAGVQPDSQLRKRFE